MSLTMVNVLDGLDEERILTAIQEIDDPTINFRRSSAPHICTNGSPVCIANRERWDKWLHADSFHALKIMLDHGVLSKESIAISGSKDWDFKLYRLSGQEYKDFRILPRSRNFTNELAESRRSRTISDIDTLKMVAVNVFETNGVVQANAALTYRTGRADYGVVAHLAELLPNKKLLEACIRSERWENIFAEREARSKLPDPEIAYKGAWGAWQ